jgi:hypothetical protein
MNTSCLAITSVSRNATETSNFLYIQYLIEYEKLTSLRKEVKNRYGYNPISRAVHTFVHYVTACFSHLKFAGGFIEDYIVLPILKRLTT